MALYRIFSNERRLIPFRALEFGAQYVEQVLEDWLEANPQILLGDEPLLVIGRQVSTPVGVVDLLAIDSTGAVVPIELKRAPSQREAVSQALEYAAYLSTLRPDAIEQIALAYLQRSDGSASLAEAWRRTFNLELPRTELNARQRIFVVIEGDDDRLGGLVRFLRNSGVDISLLKYSYYRTESGEEILNLEKEVGDEEPGRQPATDFPTEEALVASWTQEARDAYGAARDRFLAYGLLPRAKKSGVSFTKQGSSGPVFVCFATSSHRDFSLWLRADSLQARFDFDAVSATIRGKAGADVRIVHKPVWFILTIAASADRASAIASVILDEVAERL